MSAESMERVAKALGVQIVGVFSYEEKHELPDRHYTPEAPALGADARRRSVGERGAAAVRSLEPVDAGGQSRAGAHVRVQYRVAKYAAPAR